MKHRGKDRIKKINVKQLVIILLIAINSIFFISILGRYAIKKTGDFFGRSKEFYFVSDKLSRSNPTYQIEGWSGVDDYMLTIRINSYANNLLKASYDISYDITYTASDNIICQLSKNSGTISHTTNSDYFNLLITPNTTLNTGDRVYVDVTARASQPYEKEIKARFALIVGQEQLTYQIDDSVNSPYLELNITNTLSYYNIDEAFGDYSVGDKITRDVYLSLSDTNKEKCHSSIVMLTFDPNTILLDMTSDVYENALSTTTTVIRRHIFINSISFKVDALSSKKVRFYKVDETQNYTYPNGNNPCIITLTST